MAADDDLRRAKQLVPERVARRELIDDDVVLRRIADGHHRDLFVQPRIEPLVLRLEALHARYLKQFNGLDSLLAQMQSTSNFLTQQLSRLPDISLFKRD